MIKQLERFRVYHIYNTVIAGDCVRMLYVTYDRRQGWQFLAMQNYMDRISARPMTIGTAVYHPRRSGKAIMLKGLVKAEECPYEHPQETS